MALSARLATIEAENFSIPSHICSHFFTAATMSTIGSRKLVIGLLACDVRVFRTFLLFHQKRVVITVLSNTAQEKELENHIQGKVRNCQDL